MNTLNRILITAGALTAFTATALACELDSQNHAATGAKAATSVMGAGPQSDTTASQALPKVEGAWIRSAVPGQSGTGAFMRLTARQAMQLVGAATPAAGTAEVHEMKMEGDVMKMRAVDKLDLPVGRTVELKPGGYHVMLMDLKRPLTNGSTVPMTLIFRDAKGVQSKLELKVPVATQAPGAAAAPMDGHKH